MVMSTNRVTIDRPMMATGYIIVCMAFCLASCSLSRMSAICSRATPSLPVCSPTCTTLVNRELNILGCSAIASDRLTPSSSE